MAPNINNNKYINTNEMANLLKQRIDDHKEKNVRENNKTKRTRYTLILERRATKTNQPLI
jgi:hypothetical protein